MNPFTSYLTPAAGQLSTDAFQDVQFTGQVVGGQENLLRAITSGPLSFHFMNGSSVNVLTYQVLGSNDPTVADAKWVVAIAATDIAGSSGVAGDFLDVGRYLYYKVQIKAKVGGSQNTVNVAVAAKRY